VTDVRLKRLTVKAARLAAVTARDMETAMNILAEGSFSCAQSPGLLVPDAAPHQRHECGTKQPDCRRHRNDRPDRINTPFRIAATVRTAIIRLNEQIRRYDRVGNVGFSVSP